MIVIVTKMKKIPETCTKCKYKASDGWGGVNTTCSITGDSVPWESRDDRRGYKMGRNRNCPLKDMGDCNDDLATKVADKLNDSLIDEKMTIEYQGHSTQIGSVRYWSVSELITDIVKIIKHGHSNLQDKKHN